MSASRSVPRPGPARTSELSSSSGNGPLPLMAPKLARDRSLLPSRLYTRRRYRPMARVANTDTMMTIQMMASTRDSATGPARIRPRAASMTEVTGLALAKAWSHPGMEATGAKAELAKVRGRMIMNPQVLTDSGVRAVMPMKAMGQHMVNPNAPTSRTPRTAAALPPVKRNPRRMAKAVMIKMLQAMRAPSASTRAELTAERAMGRDRNRSMTPRWKSTFR